MSFILTADLLPPIRVSQQSKLNRSLFAYWLFFELSYKEIRIESQDSDRVARFELIRDERKSAIALK